MRSFLILPHAFLIAPQLLPKRDDLTPLTDPTWIAKILSEMPRRDDNTGWRGLGTQTEITELKL